MIPPPDRRPCAKRSKAKRQGAKRQLACKGDTFRLAALWQGRGACRRRLQRFPSTECCRPAELRVACACPAAIRRQRTVSRRTRLRPRRLGPFRCPFEQTSGPRSTERSASPNIEERWFDSPLRGSHGETWVGFRKY